MPRRTRFLSLLLLSCLLSAVLRAWPERRTDLSGDPSIHHGRLENGVRYLIQPNREPQNRVSLRLLVDVGSLHEREGEQGLAHFVEHMVFRGTRRHPDATLSEILQREGMGFGPDHTAFTTYDHTIYHLELPRAEERVLRLALSVFYEYSAEASLLPEALERERGVILAEKASRDTSDNRYSQFNINSLWPQTLGALRPVIGEEKVIREVTAETIRAFYDAWYRPERLVILVCGDIDPLLAETCIRDTFAGMVPRAEARPEPEALYQGWTTSAPETRLFRDPAMVGLSLHVQSPRFLGVMEDVAATRTQRLHRDLAFNVFQRRLYRLNRAKSELIVSPYTGTGAPFSTWDISYLSISTNMLQWEASLQEAMLSLRTATQQGFHAEELQVARRQFLENLEAEVRAERTRPSQERIQQMVRAVVGGYPLLSAQQVRDLWTDKLLATTPEDLNQAFRDAWGPEPWHLHFITNPGFGTPLGQLEEAVRQAYQKETKAETIAETPEFAYRAFGIEGKLTRQREEKDLGITAAEFANGVRLNFKPTRFDEDTLLIAVRIPGGRLSLPQQSAGLDAFSSWAFLPGGVGKHDPSQLADLMAGRTLQADFVIGPDSFLLRAQTSRRDLLFTCKLLAAYLTDPAWRPEALNNARAAYGSALSQLLSTPSGPIQFYGEKILFRDARFGFPANDDFFRHDMAAMRKWLGPFLKKAPVEISVVGDTQWSEVSGAVAKTFGALPQRDAWSTRKPKLPTLSPVPDDPIIFHLSDQFKQSSLAWMFPAPSLRTAEQERRAGLLCVTLEDRLFRRLREELGTTYSPAVRFVEEEGLEGLSYFLIHADVQADRVTEAAAAVRRELGRLHQDGFTDDEFARARAPFLQTRAADLRENPYWLYTVMVDMQQRPERLRAARNRLVDTESIRKAELETLFRQHFLTERAFFYLCDPVGQVPSR